MRLPRGFVPRIPLRLLGACLVAVVDVGAARSAGPVEAFRDRLDPFFKQHCLRCHGPDKVEGQLRLDELSRDLTAPAVAAHWGDILERISTGEMPPEGEPGPTPDQAAGIAETLAGLLKKGEAERLARRERLSLSKLTRAEYAYAVRDLLGIAYDPSDPAGLPEDENWQGFERIGAAQTLSPAAIEKYVAAAETILAEALPTAAPKPFEFIREGHQMNGGPIQWAEWEAAGLKDRIRYPIWPQWSLQHGRAGAGRIAEPGNYRVRIQLSGLKPERGPAPHLVVYAIELDRVLYEQDVVTKEDEPITVEFTVHLPAGATTLKILNDTPGPSILATSGRDSMRHPFTTIREGRAPWQVKLTSDDDRPLWPFLILDRVEITGPHVDPQTRAAREQFAINETGDLSTARATLRKFAERAFRRPVADDELARFVKLVESELAAKEPYPAALKTGLAAILCANDFLYVVEGNEDRPTSKLTAWELASRLSFLLWSSLPDEALIARARSGELNQPEVLRAEFRRMLADPRSARFVEAFPRQWLQLQKLGMFPPDKKLYPDYDGHLEQSFRRETEKFFGAVLAENGSLREFLDSDWAMLNARLARHYGIAGVEGDEFRRVKLDADSKRGGLLTQGAILSLTSDGQRHRPVHRGKWVMECIYGRSPPPPPANVDAIEPTPPDQPKASLRVKLDAHKSNASCAACHRKIDPLGFAFDQFDAIGRFREREVVTDGSGENPPVDAGGELPDGRKFRNAGEFKQLVVADLDRFNTALVEKLATFALRRTLTHDDRAALAAVAATSRAHDYRLRDLLEALVTSELFQRR